MMKIRIGTIFALAVLASGCATPHRDMPSETASRDIRGVDPFPQDSVAMHLTLMPRRGSIGQPIGATFNVKSHLFNNTRWPLWICPKYIFLAEQDGRREVLRVIEQHYGLLHTPYQPYANQVSLPAPSSPGEWDLYVEMTHSEKLYARYREEKHKRLPDAHALPPSDLSTTALWRGSLLGHA